MPIDCILIAYRLPLQQEQLLASQAQFQAEMQDLEDRAREEAEWQEVCADINRTAGINSRIATAQMHMRQQRSAAIVAERQFAAVKQEEEWKQRMQQGWQQQQQQQIAARVSDAARVSEQQDAAEQQDAEQQQQEHEQQMAAEQQQWIYMQQQTGIVVPLHTTPRKLDKAMSLGDVKIQAIYYLLYKYNI